MKFETLPFIYGAAVYYLNKDSWKIQESFSHSTDSMNNRFSFTGYCSFLYFLFRSMEEKQTNKQKKKPQPKHHKTPQPKNFSGHKGDLDLRSKRTFS